MAEVVPGRTPARGRLVNRNPFDWQHQIPSILVPLPDLDAIVASLLQGNGCVVVGGRGMGKSVLLSEVERSLAVSSHVRICRFDTPPVSPGLEGCLQQLCERLGVSARAELDVILDAWEAKEPGRHLVLLYDEIDALGRVLTSGGNLAMDLIAHIEAVRRRRPLGVLVAGGIGIRRLDDPVLGSPFLSRADLWYRAPFGADEIQWLGERGLGASLAAEVVESIAALTGGIPAIVVYVLGRLWGRSSIDARTVAEGMDDFLSRHRPFVNAVLRSVSDPMLGPDVLAVLDQVRAHAPALSRRMLPADGDQVLYTLQAAGLIRLEGPAHAEPVAVRPAASLLALLPRPALEGDLRAMLLADLGRILDDIARTSPDFRTQKRGVVEEKVFSALLAIALRQSGWVWDREAHRGAGRTDLIVKRVGMGEAVIEVKIWGRNDYESIHTQVASYTADETRAWVALTIADGSDPRDDYARKCLLGCEDVIEEESLVWRRRWSAPVGLPGLSGRVDHLLLVLPHR